MSDTLLAGVIGAACTILAPLIALAVRRAIDLRPFKVIPRKRREAIDGSWRGKFHQNQGPDGSPQDCEIKLTLSAAKKTVTGEGVFGSDGGQTFLVLNGVFLDDWYIRISYEDKAPYVIRYGTAFGKLASKGKRIEGEFVAYAAETEGLTTGSFWIERQP